MLVLDDGHKYSLNVLDGDEPCILRFVKREGEKYPGNIGHYCGTTTQEVLRACVDRLEYVNNQMPCAETQAARHLLEAAIVLLELRAAKHHNHFLNCSTVDEIVEGKVCKTCGHIKCEVHNDD